MIEITNLSKKYGDFLALDTLTLDIHPNKITAIVGENGSGKSTLLNILGRLQPASQGYVSVAHKDIHAYSHLEFAQKVGTLKQSNGINLRLTVKDLVCFGRYPHNQGKLSTMIS
ncbi:ATP-binding cassette domain-containing protein [Erysipelothrix sp. D19-032]